MGVGCVVGLGVGWFVGMGVVVGLGVDVGVGLVEVCVGAVTVGKSNPSWL